MFERLGAAAPSIGQRSYSPAARRPSPLAGGGRPSYASRSSLLSVASSVSSTDSLAQPRPSRDLNGSMLRQESLATPGFEDPLAVLERLIGSPLPLEDAEDGEDDDDEQPVSKPEEISEDIDLHGLSLQDFAARKPEVAAPAAKRCSYSVESAVECE